MTDPALLVVDHDPRELATFERVLRRRYGADYRVMIERSPEAALALLERLARRGEEVALVAAELRLPGMDGVEFLERAHALHRGVVRALLVAMDEYHTRIPFEELETIRHATALGRIDFWVVKGWSTPEEWLYPRVQEAMSAWTTANRSRHLVYRIVGERWDPRTHELRDMLTRNSVPFEFHPADSEGGVRLVGDFGVDTERLPALVRHDGSVLHEPSFVEVASSHGIRTRPSPGLHDLAILGAGPAGLAAAVYGASEGLATLILEPLAIGGQAGTSSMIRNYLGFPRGIGGGELAHRAWEQAVLFGAEFAFTRPATGLAARGRERVIELSDGSEVLARAVIIAAGVDYRRIGVPSLERLVGAGVFYGAAGSEAPAMAGEEVCVVGGANSAGQATLHLARYASRVTLLVRGDSLGAGMSDYLIRQIEATPNVEVRLRSRVIGGHGDVHLEALTLEDVGTRRHEDVEAAALFVMIGAEPRTEWLGDTIRRDDRGFILTGRDVPREGWPSDRPPLPFETSVPGVFAAGDVRYGSVKRVAGAVGEGSVAVGSVHQYLSERVASDAARRKVSGAGAPRRGGTDLQRSRQTEESDEENGGIRPMSEQSRGVDRTSEEDGSTFTEQIDIAASDLVDRTKELIEEGNVRRLIIRNQDGEVLLEVPLTAGVVVGGAVTIVAPVLAALGALAALLVHVKVEVVRTRKDQTDGGRPS